LAIGTSIASVLLEVRDLTAKATFERSRVTLAKIAKSNLEVASNARPGKYLTLEALHLEKKKDQL